jgi:hypothetical protein
MSTKSKDHPSSHADAKAQGTVHAVVQESAQFDPVLGRRSYQELKPRLDALRDDQLLPVNTDLVEAAIRALAVSRLCMTPERKASFDLIPRELFDPQHLVDLTPAAWTIWYTHLQFLDADAAATTAVLPAELVTSADDLKARMLKVATYHLEEDPKVAPVLDNIRSGTGHRRRATGLVRLAKIYGDHEAELRGDRKLYQAADARQAATVAQQILDFLGDTDSPERREWSDQQSRAWTLFHDLYADVQATGLWLFRAEPGVADLFPSVFLRAPRSGAPGMPDPPATPPGPPSPPGG